MNRLSKLFNSFKGSKIPYCNEIPFSFKIHNTTISDPYNWLMDINNKKVISYINEENEYYKRYFNNNKNIKSLITQIQKELISFSPSSSFSYIPEKVHNYYYYQKYIQGKNFGIFCRKQSLQGKEEIILDPNEEGTNSEFISVRSPIISLDQKRIAFAKCTTAEENYCGIIRSIKTKKILSTISSVYSMCFSKDNNHIIYTKQDHLKRPFKVYIHKLGSNQSSDTLLYHETDDSFFLDVTTSKDHEWIIISANSKDTSEIRLFNSSHLQSKPLLVHKRTNGIKFFIDHADGRFYSVNNKNNAYNFKIDVIESSKLLPLLNSSNNISETDSLWKEMVSHQSNISILDVDIFKNNIVTYVSDCGGHKIFVYNKNNLSLPPIQVPLPSDIGHVIPGGNVDYYSNILRFSYSSSIQPEITYDYNLEKNQLSIRKEIRIPNYIPHEMKCERIYVKSRDNSVDIPITLTKPQTQVSKDSPILLNVYGAYGHSLDSSFLPRYCSLWKRGWTTASVHVRGGGEKGELWHKEGSIMKKMNSMYDFIDSTKYIKDNKLAHANKICASGTSAGGLILGSICNIEPLLYKCMLMKVPFLDCLQTMLNEELPLTICEYPEWGNPSKDKHIFDYIHQYDPYLCMKDVSNYPSVYLTTSISDYQVPYWGPLKWMAKLRKNSKDLQTSNDYLLHIDDNMAHGGDGGIVTSTEECAKELAFLIHQIKE